MSTVEGLTDTHTQGCRHILIHTCTLKHALQEVMSFLEDTLIQRYLYTHFVYGIKEEKYIGQKEG